MCGRSSLTKTEKELEERFQATFYSEDLERYNPLPNYNVAPTQLHPVITNEDRDHLQLFKWGLIPFWAKDMKIGSRMINARVESLLSKNTFKSAAKKRRCLVPFDGFYEWKKTPEGKIPYRITLNSEEIFCIAGLWEKWPNPEGDAVYSFTLITQLPNELMLPIHDRMPAILLPEQEEVWLDPGISADEAVAMIGPYPSGQMRAYPVSKRVNNVRENDSALIEQIEVDSSNQQGSLF